MKHLLIACVAVAALAVPGAAMPARSAADATTYTVFLGEQGPPPAAILKLKLFGSINQFMPSKLVIAAGDSVTFSSGTFHTVTYAPKPLPLLLPGSRPRASTRALSDAAGSPFYFDACRSSSTTAQAFGPFGPKTISGKTPVSSGGLSPRRSEGAARDRDLRVPEGGDVPPVLHAPPGHEGDRRRQAGRAAVPKTPDQVKAQALRPDGGRATNGGLRSRSRRSEAAGRTPS